MAHYGDVFRRLRVEMNGAVSESMRDYGMKYGMNYGVSLTTIRTIATEFGVDHNLAADLWRQEVRELKLAAIFIEEPMQVTSQQMRAWGENLLTSEIAQVSAMNLWCKCPCAVEVAREWFAGDCDLRHLAACHTIGRITAQLTQYQVSQFVGERANAYLLREIYRYHTALRGAVREVAANVEDLTWQLDEIDLED